MNKNKKEKNNRMSVDFDIQFQKVIDNKEMNVSLTDIVVSYTSSLNTFTEVELVRPLLEKAEKKGTQALTNHEFDILYQILILLNTKDKIRVLDEFRKSGIDLVKYENETRTEYK